MLREDSTNGNGSSSSSSRRDIKTSAVRRNAYAQKRRRISSLRTDSVREKERICESKWKIISSMPWRCHASCTTIQSVVQCLRVQQNIIQVNVACRDSFKKRNAKTKFSLISSCVPARRKFRNRIISFALFIRHVLLRTIETIEKHRSFGKREFVV